MAGWSGLSAAACGAVLVGGAAVVALAGYFGLRAPAPVAELPSETAASGGGVAEPGTAGGDAAAPSRAENATTGAAVTEPAAAIAGQVLPSFDVARIAPDGAATVAGQAAPGASVAMLVDGVEVASVVADGQGKFAALFDLPPSPVARLLSLQATGADGVVVTGAESVALAPVAVAAGSETVATAPVVQAPAAVLVAPEGVKVLQSGADVPAEVPDAVALDTISYAPDGAVLLGGRAKAGTGLRVYLDGVAIADVAVAPDGAWAATLKDVAAGIYTLRVDQLGTDGKVTSRFETPFKRETLEALAAAAGSGTQPEVSAAAAPVVAGAVQPVAEPAPAVENAEVGAVPASPAAETEVPAGDAAPAAETAPAAATAPGSATAPSTEVTTVGAEPEAVAATKPAPVTVTVQPGYTLWGIAQRNFGEGVMYVQVFEANKDKIKDPDLIYPGQVFTIPVAP